MKLYDYEVNDGNGNIIERFAPTVVPKKIAALI